MAELYTIAAAHVTLIRDGTVELTQVAEMGAEGVGTLGIDDTNGTLSVVGQTDVAITQSSCANTRTFGGFVDDREYERGSERAPDVAAGRWITVQLIDLNNYLSQTGITGTDGKRPAETISARMTWLTGSAYWPAGVTAGSRVTSSSIDLDKADYRQQQPGDVLADMATAGGGFNYYVADWGSGPELTFRDDNTSTSDSSAVRISNVLADVDSSPETLGAAKTFAPSQDFKLNRSPREVYSKMSLSYAKGTVTDEDTGTEVNGERYGTASNSNIKTVGAANTALTSLLHIHSTERDFLEGSILVPASAVNLLRQGERCEVKFSHLNTERYGSFTWCRVMERTVKPLNAEGAIYELRLRLSPQEAGPPAPPCSTGPYPLTASGNYYPLGGSGSVPNASDGVVYYWRGGQVYPTVPTPGLVGSWHFPAYSAGGSGTIDYMGDCVGNRVLFMVVGNGAMSVITNTYGGSPRNVALWYQGAIVDSGTSGDTLTYTVADAVDGDCIRIVELRDNTWPTCGGKVGWSQMTWTAA